MLLLPADTVACLAPFAPLFSRPVWRHVQVLLVGAILAPGRRMVSSALRAVDLGSLPQFQRYHRVLNRAVWSSLGASRILLGLLVAAFASAGRSSSALTKRSNGAVGPRSLRPESIATRCAPVTDTSSRYAGCVGSRYTCLCPSPGQARSGRCRS